MLRPLQLLLLICYCSVCPGQSTLHTTTDSAIGTKDNYKTNWLTIGGNYDALNSLYGMILSNGSDEQPIIHFEDLTTRVLYKLQGQTDFKKDYSFGAKLSWNYPFGRIYLANIEYFQRSINSSGLFQRDIDLSTTIGLHFINSNLLVKVGHEQLNNQSNFGAGIGIQKSFKLKLYGGFMVSYYFDYFDYSVFLQSFIVKKISLRVAYDKINTYDFLNLGVHYTFRQ